MTPAPGSAPAIAPPLAAAAAGAAAPAPAPSPTASGSPAGLRPLDVLRIGAIALGAGGAAGSIALIAPPVVAAPVLLGAVATLAGWSAVRTRRASMLRGGLGEVLNDVDRAVGRAPSTSDDDLVTRLASGVEILGRALAVRDERLGQLDGAIRDEATRRTQRHDDQGHAWEAFLARLSHEARTRLTTLRGSIDDLAGVAAQDRSDHAAMDQATYRTMADGLERLTRLLDETIDLSHLESGRLEPNLTEFPVSELIADVLADALPAAVGAEVGLSARAVDPIPGRVRTDRHRVQQLLGDLIGHVVQTAAGTGDVSIELSRTLPGPQTSTGDCPTNTGAPVRVDAVGIGGGSELSILVFDDAGTIDPDSMSTDRPELRIGDGLAPTDGPHLGMVIARTIARQLGLSLSVVRLDGGGCAFRVGIPFDGPAHEPVTPERFDRAVRALDDARRSSERERRERIEGTIAAHLDDAGASGSGESRGLDGFRILLIEDQADIRRLLLRHLGRAGAELDIASDGAEGLVALDEADASGRPFDMAVVDLRLPGVDGLEVIRREQARGRGTGLLVLTASAMAGDRDRCIEAGADAYMSKPFDAVELIERCQEVSATAMHRRRPDREDHPAGVGTVFRRGAERRVG
ncbi:MAG: response regulator [Phycisphaerales bacterium]